MKKGDLSINIIIVAAIALIILVIISVLVFRTGSQVNTGTSCIGIGGKCTSGGDCSEFTQDGENWVQHSTAKCVAADNVCCFKQ